MTRNPLDRERDPHPLQDDWYDRRLSKDFNPITQASRRKAARDVRRRFKRFPKPEFKVEPLSGLNLSDDVFSRLSLMLRRMEEGSDLAIVAPIFGDRAPEDVLKGWDKVFEPLAATLRTTLAEMEASNRSKFGPRSRAKPWVDRKAGILESFELPTFDVTEYLSLESMLTTGEGSRLRPLDIVTAAEYLQPNTNSGLPFLTKKKLVKEQAIAEHQALLLRDDPAVAFTRTQEDWKTRLVWGQSIASVLEEMAFFQVLLPLRKQLQYRSALNGPDAVERSVGFIFDRMSDGDILMSVDFSRFDASVSPSLSNAALSMLLRPFQSTYVDRVREIVRRFVSCGLVTPDGIFTGMHGVPSGSTFTNEVDSMVQFMVAMRWFRDRFRDQVHRYTGSARHFCDVQGDDGIHSIPKGSEKSFVEYFTAAGLEVNESKSHVATDECIYLQNYFHKEDRLPDGGAKGVYPTYRALNRIVHPERWTDLDDELTGQDFFAIRTISILENCKRHPMFEQFVKYVASITDLSFSSEGHKAYLSRIVTKGKAGILHAHGEFVSGIHKFETMRVLRG